MLNTNFRSILALALSVIVVQFISTEVSADHLSPWEQSIEKAEARHTISSIRTQSHSMRGFVLIATAPPGPAKVRILRLYHRPRT